ncbi:MAG: hypothetical protein IJF65_06550 [Clostridia bacterium]|nr:hypothetical protein [Clostridia bacterium]
MKRILAFLTALCLMMPGLAFAQQLEDMLAKGTSFMSQGDLASAEICYDIAMKLDPGDTRALVGLSSIYVLRGEKQAAIETIQKAVDIAPADGETYLAQARILLMVGEKEAAQKAVQYAQICGATPDASLTAALAEDQPAAQQPAAPEKDDALARAVAENAAALTPVELNLEGYWGSCSIVFYEANKADADAAGLMPTPSEDGQRMLLAQLTASDVADYRPLAVSPTGKVTLVTDGSGLAAVHGNEVTVITPNYARGAKENEYKDATLGLSEKLGTLLEQDSVAWSPDERYFTLTFPVRAVQQMRYWDLILGDVQTGEIFLAEATPSKFNQDGASGTIAAAFDPEGKYIYYLAYGRFKQGHCALKRYEIATGKIQMLACQENLFMYQPRLAALTDGTVRTVTDQSKAKEYTGVVTFQEKGGRWAWQVKNFPLPVGYQRAQRYLYSENSGHELIINYSGAASGYFFYLTLDGEALMLPVDGSVCEKLPVNENLGGEGYLQVINAELSPDGHFALARTQLDLYLIDLETLAFAPVALPEGWLLVADGYAGRANRYGINWFGDNSVLVPTTEGSLLCRWGR